MLVCVDHGNKQIKTASRVFTSGLVESDTRPPFGDNILFYRGKYYTLSDQRIPYTRDKTEDDRFFILTLFAIAYEINTAGQYVPDRLMNIQLAVGLPPAHYGTQYKRFAQYFLNRGVIGFEFNGRKYSICITEAVCFPQALAATAPVFKRLQLGTVAKATVIDIGGFTADYLSLRYGAADWASCDSLENGVITLYNRLLSKIRADHDLLLEETDIDSILTGCSTEYGSEIQTLVERGAESFVADLFRTLRERKIELRTGKVIFVGGGCVISGADQEVRELAHRIQAPVCDTLMGKGTFPGEDPLYTGMVGMHGTKTSDLGVTECDLLIVLGARFSDRVTGNAKKFAQNAKILQFDVDAAEMNKNILITEGVVGDLKVVLQKMNERLEQQDHKAWVEQIMSYKEKYPMTYHPDVLSGPFVVEEIYRQTNGEAIISTEVGQHQMWAAQYYKYTEPRTLLTSGGLGTMGYGLGASLGAKVGRPEKTVVNIAGDGCFRMNMNEIATAARHNIPVIQVVINNHVLGMVRQWQNLFYGQRYSATVLNDAVDFVKLAEAMGAEGVRVATQEEFKEAFANALKSGHPVVIDCQIDSDDKVWPMVAPGAPINEAFDEKDLEAKNAE